MNRLLRRILHIDDESMIERASQTDREIETTKQEYDQKLQALQLRKNHQAIAPRSSDRVMEQWAGAMAILRTKE